MIIIGTTAALAIIYAGVFLLAKNKKEMLGSFFNYASWFFIVMGFLMLGYTGIRGCFMKQHMKMKHEKHNMCCAHQMHGETECKKQVKMKCCAKNEAPVKVIKKVITRDSVARP